ncbi:mitochondrial fission regulator 1-like isoform X2 [Hydractinia symbiolongicarpus]|nr:mitochondrial fission regulator 1-like isoform X2 [Hydractinia symbiolongicarpus]
MKTKRRSSAIHKREYSSHVSLKTKRMGSNRSVVRYIGSNVPIAPSKREYLELIDHSRKAFMSHASTFISANLDQMRQHVDHVKYHVVPTLADLGQLVWEDGFDEEDVVEENDQLTECEEEAEDEKSNKEDSISIPQSSKPTNETNSTEDKKISHLEDELAKLRAQIAMIVSTQGGASTTTGPTQPTPVAVVPPTAVAPPPPPPPPPLPPPQTLAATPNTQKLVKRKKSEEEKQYPVMDDLLKGLSTVKLKTVDISRSPGGTPLKRNVQPRADSTNPADIIARALREKFQKSRLCYDSPEKDGSPQSGFTPSPVRKHKKSPKVHSTLVRPVPRPRPKPRTKKRISKTEKSEGNKDNHTTNISFT